MKILNVAVATSYIISVSYIQFGPLNIECMGTCRNVTLRNMGVWLEQSVALLCALEIILLHG